MGQARGSDAVFALFEEDTFGNDPASPDGQKLFLKQFGLSKSQEKIEDETLTAGRGVAEPLDGSIDAGGPLEGNLGGQSFGTLLKHMLGLVSTTGAGPYTHVFTIGALPIGLTLELDNGVALAGAGRYVKYNGCRIGSAEFTFTDKGPVNCSFTIVGADGVQSSTPLDVTLTDNGHKSFNAFSAALLEGGSAYASAKTVTIRIDNDLDSDGFVLGGQGKRQEIPEGQSKVTGSITGLLNAAGQALVDKGLSSTETSMKITLTDGDGLGSAGNESIEFLVQQMKYEKVVPGVTGPAGREFSMDWSAYLSGSDLGLEITLKNALSAV